MTATYTRDSVRFHSDGFGERRPAVNVKIYRDLRDAWPEFERTERSEDGLTLEWIEEQMTEERIADVWGHACVSEFEYLERWATGADGDSLFPDDSVTLHWTGRSGGWIEVSGLPDIEEWSAVHLARWRRFERIARELADGVPLQTLCLIEINDYEWARDEEEERERAARQDIATIGG